MESNESAPFHAFTHQPNRSSVALAMLTPAICLALIALVIAVSGVYGDPSALAAVGGFGLVVVGCGVSLSLPLLRTEEILIDRSALLIRSSLGRRVRERSFRLERDAHARVGPDPRWKFGHGGSSTVVRLKTVDGRDLFFGEMLNTSQQSILASKINAFLASPGKG